MNVIIKDTNLNIYETHFLGETLQCFLLHLKAFFNACADKLEIDNGAYRRRSGFNQRRYLSIIITINARKKKFTHKILRILCGIHD